MSKNKTSKPLEIKIATVVAVVALLGETDHAKLSAALKQITGGTPDYFEDDFTLLDFGPVSPAPVAGSINWPRLIALFKSHRLNPVAVRNAPAELEDEIRANGLTIDNMVQPRQPAPEVIAVAAPEPEPAPAPAPVKAAVVKAAEAPAAQATPALPAMIIDTPVRGGQRIYARGCDLIITAMVNHGAEVIADGSIHVYAPLRGRALAGASGNAQARIFSLAMEAELVSIAGIYRTFDEGWPAPLAAKPAQISLVDERLDIVAITSK
jgi:septum site-determining protein MinC